MRTLINRQRVAFALIVTAAVCAAGLLLRAEPLQPVGAWMSIGPVAQSRSGAAAVTLADGRTLIAGGTGLDGSATDGIVAYDPTSNSFENVGRMIVPRVGHTATLLKDNRVLFAGGLVAGVVSSDIEMYDPATRTSTLVALLVQPRAGHAAARLADDTVLIVGGTTVDGLILRSAEIADPATGNVMPALASLQQPRTGATATTLAHGHVLVAGGNDGSSDLRTAELYDGFSQTFAVAETQLSEARSGHTAVLLPHNNSVLIAGGTSATVPVDAADLFLPAEFPDPFSYGVGWFTATGSMTTARTRAIGGGTSVDGYAFVAGGGSADAEVYRFPTIKTDKDDYAPGERAVITGTGWQPLQDVTLLFQEDPAVHDDYELTVRADADGNIFWDRWAPERHDLGVRFFLMAKQADGRAQTTFTDAELVTSEVTGTGNDVTVVQGNPTVSSSISLSATGNISTAVTAANPAVVRVHTTYTINGGTVSFADLSGALNFFANGTSGNNAPVTWTVAPTPYSVSASFSADGATAAGNYSISLSEASKTLTISNPNPTGGKLEDSTATNLTVHVRLATPSQLQATPVSQTRIDLGWNDESTGETDFLIESSANAAGPFSTLAVVPAGSESFSHTTGLSCGTTRYYRVQARKTVSGVVLNSDVSGVISGTTSSCNTAPVANPQTVTTVEDVDVVVTLSGSDVDGNPLTFKITSLPADGRLFQVAADNVSPDAQITTVPTPLTNGQHNVLFRPDATEHGTPYATFRFKVHDGSVDSAETGVTVNVTGVNDPPSFFKGADVTVNEDSAAFGQANWATGINAGPANEASQTVSFVVTNDHNALFSVQPAVGSNGTLTFTPAPNAFGMATVSVSAQDNGGTADGGADTSAAQTFTITLSPVNDAPSFAKGADVTVNEDSGAFAQAWATDISAGPANEGAQTVTFVVTNDDNALFSSQPAVGSDGMLTFTPAPNAFGVATVAISAQDNGGTANDGVDTSAAQTFTITVNSVNDAPSFANDGDVTVNEDSAAFAQAWATGISAGPANETGQTVSFVVTNDQNALFSVQPGVSGTGTLMFAPAADAFGTATVTVHAEDNGGTANGGADTSAAQTFTITINAVNDAPSFVKGGDVTVNEDSGAFTQGVWATSSAGPANESSQTVSFVVTNDQNALFSAQPAVNSAGTLTFTPEANAFGTATVTVFAQDDGGTANGGADASAAQTFTITVNSVNDAPSFVKGSEYYEVLANSGAHTVTGWATGLSAGPANESSQVLAFVIASNSNPGLFSAGPAVSSNGTLTFTPAANAVGTATVGVQLKDDGGTAHGGVDTSAIQYFSISVKFAPEGTLCGGEPGHSVLAPFKSGADGFMNVVAKTGSTVPVKFRVCGADGVSIGPTPEVVAGFYFLGATTDQETEEGTPITESTTPDTKFRWSGSQWIFNLPTRQLSARLSYWYRIELIDGSTMYFSVTTR